MSKRCDAYDCEVEIEHPVRCGVCDGSFCNAHSSHGAFGDAGHGEFPDEITLVYLRDLKSKSAALEATLDPVRDWYDGDGRETDVVKMLAMAVADLRRDRASVLALEAALREIREELDSDDPRHWNEGVAPNPLRGIIARVLPPSRGGRQP